MGQKKLHILFITKWYPNPLDPQLGVFVRKHAEAVALKSKVTVIYVYRNDNIKSRISTEQKTSGSIREIIVAYNPGGKSGSGKLITAILYIKAFFKAWKILLKEDGKPDIVHAHILLRPAVLSYLLSIFYRIPYLVTEHWTGFVFDDFAGKSRLYKILSKLAVSRAKYVTVVSSGLMKAMKKNGLVKSDYQIVPNVVESISAGDASRKSTGEKIILTIADLTDKNKNISGALSVMNEIFELRNDFVYHIIGGGPDEAMLKAKAEKLGLGKEQVVFHGRQDNKYVMDFLGRASFVLTNSHVETFSVATAEAMAAGKPVVATISGGPEDFVDEQCGILIPAGNREELKRALLTMLDHYTEYDPAYLKEKIMNTFNSEVIGEQFHDLYLKIPGNIDK